MRVERGGGASGVGAEIPLQPLKRTQATPAFHVLQPVGRAHTRVEAKCEEEGAAEELLWSVHSPCTPFPVLLAMET